MIEDIEETLGGKKENDESFAFFYCNRNEENRRNTLDILRSYVRQLSTTPRKLGRIYSELKQLYADSQLKGAGWTLGLCRENLIKLLNLYPRTTLVLDALDECKPEERVSLLDFFDSIPSKCSKPVRIFISSRPEGDIRQRLIYLSNIEIQATDNENDIAEFVMQSIEKNGRWSGVLRKNQPLKEKIVQTLLTQSNGMFQWAMLQIKQLLNLRTESEICSRLGKLPKDLKTAYDEIFANIEALEADAGALSVAALRWAMCAYHPLPSKTLLAAINVNPEQETGGSLEIEEDDLLDWTANLLRVDAQQNPPVWRVSHLSVVEYLETRWTVLEAHCYVAKACLALLVETYRDEDEQQKNTLPDIVRPDHPLQVYVRHHWIRHAQTQEDQDVDPKLTHLFKTFLGSLEKSSVHYRGWHRQILSEDRLESIDPLFEQNCISPGTAAVFAVCRFSFYNLLRDWWDKASLEILPTHAESGDDLLALAAAAGCEPICLRLYELGMPINIVRENRTYSRALTAAAYNGHLQVVRLLVDKGADVNQPTYPEFHKTLPPHTGDRASEHVHYHNALSAAAHSRHREIVRFLVDKGANIDGWAYSMPVLSSAVFGQDMWIVRFLVDKGADVNQLFYDYDWFISTAMVAESDKELREIVDYIWNLKGANVSEARAAGYELGYMY